MNTTAIITDVQTERATAFTPCTEKFNQKGIISLAHAQNPTDKTAKWAPWEIQRNKCKPISNTRHIRCSNKEICCS
jgi:hypothetical protein